MYQLRVVNPANTSTISVATGATGQWFALGAPFIDIQVIGGAVAASGDPSWTSGGTVQAVGLGATTTAPTAATTTVKNNVSYRQLGPKTWQVMGIYSATTTTGGAAGNGDYLFTLPAGLSFDTTLPFQTVFSGQVQTNTTDWMSRVIPGSTNYLQSASAFQNGYQSGIVPWSATQYRIVVPIYTVTIQPWGSSLFAFSTAFNAMWTFTFQST